MTNLSVNGFKNGQIPNLQLCSPLGLYFKSNINWRPLTERNSPTEFEDCGLFCCPPLYQMDNR
jgi:hypothetical protein